ncbi:hypothetical protein AB0L66_34170 [Streptomyces sp. NPDC052207]
MMAQIQDDFEEVTRQLERLGLNLLDDDVHAFISGPSIVIDAIALY